MRSKMQIGCKKKLWFFPFLFILIVPLWAEAMIPCRDLYQKALEGKISEKFSTKELKEVAKTFQLLQFAHKSVKGSDQGSDLLNSKIRIFTEDEEALMKKLAKKIPLPILKEKGQKDHSLEKTFNQLRPFLLTMAMADETGVLCSDGPKWKGLRKGSLMTRKELFKHSSFIQEELIRESKERIEKDLTLLEDETWNNYRKKYKKLGRTVGGLWSFWQLSPLVADLNKKQELESKIQLIEGQLRPLAILRQNHGHQEKIPREKELEQEKANLQEQLKHSENTIKNLKEEMIKRGAYIEEMDFLLKHFSQIQTMQGKIQGDPLPELEATNRNVQFWRVLQKEPLHHLEELASIKELAQEEMVHREQIMKDFEQIIQQMKEATQSFFAQTSQEIAEMQETKNQLQQQGKMEKLHRLKQDFSFLEKIWNSLEPGQDIKLRGGEIAEPIKKKLRELQHMDLFQEDSWEQLSKSIHTQKARIEEYVNSMHQLGKNFHQKRVDFLAKEKQKSFEQWQKEKKNLEKVRDLFLQKTKNLIADIRVAFDKEIQLPFVLERSYPDSIRAKVSPATKECRTNMCFLCSEEYSSDRPVIQLKCGSEVCSDCLHIHLRSTWSEKMEFVACPYHVDEKLETVIPNLLSDVFDPHLIYLLAREDFLKQSLPYADHLKCSRPSCKYVYTIGKMEKKKQKGQILQCPDCHQKTCSACGTVNHEGFPCQIDREALLARLKNNGEFHCPYCGPDITFKKDEGRDFVRCPRCKRPLDAETGQPWTKKVAKRKGYHLDEAID